MQMNRRNALAAFAAAAVPGAWAQDRYPSRPIRIIVTNAAGGASDMIARMIGTGLTATDEQANETIGVIREAVKRQYGAAVSDAVRIQYGGSMNPKNVKGLMAQPEIDGGLIGGASLKAPDFTQVVLYNK